MAKKRMYELFPIGPTWDGSPALVKRGPGHIVVMQVTTGAEAGPVYLVIHDARKVQDIGPNTISWIEPLPPSFVNPIPAGEWTSFGDGCVIEVRTNPDGSGSLPSNSLLVTGRYR